MGVGYSPECYEGAHTACQCQDACDCPCHIEGYDDAFLGDDEADKETYERT